MRGRKSFAEIRRDVSRLHLPCGEEFRIHYTLRNQTGATGYGAMGVRDPSLIALYCKEMQWAYRFLVHEMALQPPARLPIDVYVLEPAELDDGSDRDSSPRTLREIKDGRGQLAIVLPSRSPLGSAVGRAEVFRAAAIHEVAHVVCFSQPGFVSVAENWEWMAEGTAEWVVLRREREKGNGVPASALWADHWDYPHVPLGNEDDRNGATLFLEFLETRHPGLIGRMWRTGDARRGTNPWREILRETGNPRVFVDYSMAAYFVNDSRSELYWPQLFDSIRERAWEQSIGEAEDINPVVVGGSVRIGSCRYYSVRPKPGLGLQIALAKRDERAVAGLAGVDGSFRKVGDVTVLNDESMSLTEYECSTVDHFIVVITAVLESRVSYGGVSDEVEYEISVQYSA